MKQECVDYPHFKRIPISHPMQDNHYFVEYFWYSLLIKWREGIAREGIIEE